MACTLGVNSFELDQTVCSFLDRPLAVVLKQTKVANQQPENYLSACKNKKMAHLNSECQKMKPCITQCTKK